MFISTSETFTDLQAFCESTNLIGSLANVSAFLMSTQKQINWVGFYFLKNKELILGPFQGKPACTRIALGKGVCGTAALTKTTLVVDDVDAFPGHIVCDSQSRSEIVVPLLQKGRVVGVLDVDSPQLSRFQREDREFYEKVADVLVQTLDFGGLQ